MNIRVEIGKYNFDHDSLGVRMSDPGSSIRLEQEGDHASGIKNLIRGSVC